ncbi:unnamed protein product [Adineta ricciae]|uniref:Endonuclease/exonuclease/phosphatase family domain-containing protein 1 n=1 Tax=Adineta ricciae TaxID=249248 RepID=A0A814TJN1_ADIRI|nr:unnamed protein product [Adineta ricciae]
MDINRVSEDELLLLPGVNRQLAHHIVEYRQANGGFTQTNELLQVNGMTPRLFKSICREMTLSTSNEKKQLLDLNVATYTELCCIPGLTPNLATKILNRRHQKKGFHSVEELLKVKGMDYIILSTIRPHVTIKYQQTATASDKTETLSRTSLFLDTLPPEIHAMLVSSSSQQLTCRANGESRSKHFRIASWNLQQLTSDKAQNPGVKEVICRIILLNNFSIIAIQEIGSKESLDFIINELNNPTIPSIKNLSNSSQGKWKYTISDAADQIVQGCEHLGFLYDGSSGIELKQTSSLRCHGYFERSPCIAVFGIYNKIELVLVNMHLKAKKSDEDKNEQTKYEAKALSVLARAMKDTIKQKHKIILGSFNIIPTASDFEALIECNYSSVIAENTDISLKMLQGTSCVDNIWLSIEAKALYTGSSGVIRDSLTSPWIPTGWTLGGLVSDHCPLWAEFSLS